MRKENDPIRIIRIGKKKYDIKISHIILFFKHKRRSENERYIK